MSWTQPIDESRLRHLRRVWATLQAFLVFDTRRLIDLSEWAPFLARFSLTVSLFTIASAITILASTYFYPNNTGPLDFINWSVPVLLILAALLVLPALIGYRFIKIRRFFFVANMVLLQQAFLALAVIGAHAVLLSAEPARTDFAMLWDGAGQRTVAFQRYCGGLEVSAELVELTQRAQSRGAAVLRDLKRVHSWGEPTPEKAAQRMPELEIQFQRRVGELRDMRSDLERQRTLIAQRERLIAAFLEAYPTYFRAERLFTLAFLVIVLWSTIHLARAALLGDRGKKAAAVAVFGFLVTWGVSIGFAWSALSNAGFPLYSDVITRPLSPVLVDGERVDLGEQIRAYEREHSRISAEAAETGSQLRGELYRMRNVCPRIDTRGII